MKRLFKAPGSSSAAMKVRVYWGDILYDTVLAEPNQPVTIGRKPGTTFVMDLGKGATTDMLPLLTIEDATAATLRFDKGTEGHVRFDGKLVTLASARSNKQTSRDEKGLYTLRLSDKDRASVVIGHVSFDIDWVREFHKVPRPIVLDKRAALFGGLVSLFSILMLSLLTVPERPEEEPPPERIVEIIPPKELMRAKAALGQRKTEDGGAQKGEAGKADLATPKAETPPPSAADTLRNANLGSLVNNLSAATTAPAPTSAARSAAAVAAATNQTGTGGFTTEGFKQGAGGKSVGIGRTVGAGEGGFEGTGKLGLSGNSLVEGSAGHGVTGPGPQTGGLDRAVIDQIVRRRQDRIRLCYERQLNFNPKLAGKLTVQFVIGKEGEVVGTQILEDTMKSAPVRDCISTEVKSWTFPKPTGGTLVKVDYPFVFESGGGGSIQ